MRKFQFAIVLASVFIAQPALADQDMSDSKPCATIAKACLDAGFTREGDESKKFWKDCMKPVILGQKVENINIDEATVKQCRSDKISKLKKELMEFQKAFNNKQ